MSDAETAETEKSIARGMQDRAQKTRIGSPDAQAIAVAVDNELKTKNVTVSATAGKIMSGTFGLRLGFISL